MCSTRLLAGARPFDGRSAARLLVGILNTEPPPLRERQPLLPDAVDDIVRGCLEKDPDARWQAMGDVARQLRWVARARADASGPGAPPRSVWRRHALLAGLLSALLVAITLAALSRRSPGRMEVFVEPFPPSGPRWQVSSNGGSQPVWRRDGRELFFLGPDGKLMVAAVHRTGAFVHGPPQPLFQTRMRPPYPPYPVNYDVTADGQRFLIDGVRPDTGPNVSIIVNWTAATGFDRR